MHTRNLPFSSTHWAATVIVRVVEGKRPARPTRVQAPQLSDELWTLITFCWKQDWRERRTSRFLFSCSSLRLIFDFCYSSHGRGGGVAFAARTHASGGGQVQRGGAVIFAAEISEVLDSIIEASRHTHMCIYSCITVVSCTFYCIQC
jgi:hypothetical protein